MKGVAPFRGKFVRWATDFLQNREAEGPVNSLIAQPFRAGSSSCGEVIRGRGREDARMGRSSLASAEPGFVTERTQDTAVRRGAIQGAQSVMVMVLGRMH